MHISKLIEMKINSDYFMGYLKWVVKDEDEDKNRNNKLMSFCIDDDKLSETFKSTWIKIEDLQNIEMNALSVYDVIYIKPKIRIYGGNIYINFRGLNVSYNVVECECFIIIAIDSLLVYANKYYLQVYLDNCAYKIIDKQI